MARNPAHWTVWTRIQAEKAAEAAEHLMSCEVGILPTLLLISPFGKDENSHASPVDTILSFALYVMGSIPHGDIHTLLSTAHMQYWKGF
jgi:hypothetical protein